MPRKKHYCDLDLGSDSMLPKKKTFLGRACRWLRKLGQLTKHHPETFEHFRSYSAVVAERQRQLLEDGGRVIHPLSIFSLIWMSFMIIVNITHMCLSTFRLFFVVQPLEKLHTHPIDLALLGVYFICVVDIGIKLNTGYLHKKHFHIVMSRKYIFCRYLRRWFILDLASSLPVAYVLIRLNIGARFILIAHVLSILRTARVYTVCVDLQIFMKVFMESYIVNGLVRLVVLFLMSAHWCSCLMYSPAIILYYWTGEMPTQYNYYMRIHGSNNLMFHEIEERYNKAIIIALSAFFGENLNLIANADYTYEIPDIRKIVLRICLRKLFVCLGEISQFLKLGTGFTMFRSTEPDEILIHSVIIVYAAMFMVFTLVFLIKSYLTIFGSTMRYEGLMDQVEQYMKYRQFPLSLKKRVRAFYEYRYQERYYKEEADLACLSEELRDEIKLHTCRTLVHKVKLFEDVPANVVGTVLGCLQPEVYLSNDLVVQAGDIGDCMYFIATGTVAVYSLKGIEVCHLEDGNHFGEVALLMKDSKRVATVVAVEITQLYRLDASDFNRFVLSHSTLNSRIEDLASRRMHETILLDDTFRHERELSHTEGQLQSDSATNTYATLDEKEK